MRSPARSRASDSTSGQRDRASTPGSWRSRNVLVLGVVSFLTDTASEMVVPLLPAFVTGVLGASAFALGWIEGLADAVASVLKLLSGRWADRLGRNRPFVLAGYALAAVARPLTGLAGAVWHVVAIRTTDRIGKGIRTSPRDALIAQSVRPGERGAAFGLQRAFDHGGAVLGPLLATGFLLWVGDDLRTLFLLTAIPGAAAVVVVALGVREGGAAPRAETAPGPVPPARETGELSAPMLRFLIPLALFTLGHASHLFLLLKAGGGNGSLAALPLLWMGLHVVKAASSVPGGALSDRWGRSRVILAGWLLHALVYTGLAFAEEPGTVWLLFLSYGLYHGLTEGAERAWMAELAAPLREGSAFGWYHGTIGLLTLAASVLFGGLWEAFGSRTAFLTGASLALAACLALFLLRPDAAER